MEAKNHQIRIEDVEMSKTSRARVLKRTLIWSGVMMLVLWVVAFVIGGFYFVQASEAARLANDGALFPQVFLGMPLFEGFHADGRFGVHPQWGVLVILVVPAAVGVAIAAAGLLRARRLG